MSKVKLLVSDQNCKTDLSRTVFRPQLLIDMKVKNFSLYAQITRVIAITLLFVPGILGMITLEKLFSQNRLYQIVFIGELLLFGISFLFQEKTKGNSISDLWKKSNNAITIIRIVAIIFFTLHIFLYIFLSGIEFFNSIYRYIFLYLAVVALSLSQVIKHISDTDPSGKVNLIFIQWY